MFSKGVNCFWVSLGKILWFLCEFSWRIVCINWLHQVISESTEHGSMSILVLLFSLLCLLLQQMASVYHLLQPDICFLYVGLFHAVYMTNLRHDLKQCLCLHPEYWLLAFVSPHTRQTEQDKYTLSGNWVHQHSIERTAVIDNRREQWQR